MFYHCINVSFLVIAGKEINVTMTIENKECPDAEGQYNKSSLSRELSVTVKLQSYNCSINMGLLEGFSQRKRCSGGWRGGGLAARSGTECTWSPQLSNLAEWDWEPIFLQNKYGGEWHPRAMRFCSVLSFPTSKHQEKVVKNFFRKFLDIRWRDGWTVHGSLHLSWFAILYPGSRGPFMK